MLLVIDTCTERMVVGVRWNDTREDRWINLDSRQADGPANHARDLLPAIGKLLEGERPRVVGVALGPGSFTGVRIGLATAKGLADGWEVPLVALDNLAAMDDAWRRLKPNRDVHVLPVIDARKNKYYAALYHNGREVSPPADRSADDWADEVRRLGASALAITGYQGSHLAQKLGTLTEGWSVLDTLDWTPGLLDQAEREWQQGRFLGPDAAPRYLRLSEAEENLRSRSV